MLRSIVVSLPPFIADYSVAIDSETAADLKAATPEIAKLDSSHADDLSHWAPYCSVPNQWRHRRSTRSKPTSTTTPAHYTASANSSAVAMAAATTALQAMIATVGPNAPSAFSAIHHGARSTHARRPTGVFRRR